MRKALAVLMLAISAAAWAFGATLVNSYYDVSLQAWVCTYRTAQGTTITQLHRNFCPITI